MEIDREKVIKGLECCAVPGGNCLECPYGNYGVDENGLECENKMAADALELLKADQAELIRQRDIISKYRKADEFLALHGWEWKDD